MIRAAYLFYYFVSEELGNETQRYTALMNDALITAKEVRSNVYGLVSQTDE
jgi:hypothetical protein